MTTAIVVLIFLFVSAVASAKKKPSRWHVPTWWLRGAMCIHNHESTDWHIVNHPYEGGMQFMEGTWTRAGGHSNGWRWASVATPGEQLYRAYRIWRQDGGSWREWPNTSRACGLR